MPLVLAESWLRAANAGATPVFLVTITYGATTVKALSASCSLFEYPESVVDVDPVASEIDPLTRELKVSEVEVQIQDAWLRPILVANRLTGQKVTIRLGFAEIPEADFCPYAAGPIEEIQPDCTRDDGVITLTVCDVFSILEKTEIAGAWFNIHPLQALYKGDGTGILERCKIPASMIDTASFDPTDSRYSTISHWCVSRVQDWDVMKPENALDLANSVCQILNGQLVTTEEGLVSFKRFDATAAVVDTWTMDDVIDDDPIEQDPIDANVINRVSMSFGGGQYSEHEWVTFELNDTDSQAACAYPGTAERIITHEIKTEWIGSYHAMPSVDLAAGATSMTVQAQVHAISGNRAAYPGPQPASAAVSASRPVWLYVGNIVNTAEPGEVVKATACTVTTASVAFVQPYADPGLGTTPDWTYRNAMAFSSMSRGQLGTTDAAHVRSSYSCQTNVWDISILATLGPELLQRFKYGCEVIRFYTPITKMAAQRGDLISCVFPGVLGFGLDGCDALTKWEIVRKEASATRIGWTLAKAVTTAHVGGGRGFGRVSAIGAVSRSSGVILQDTARGFFGGGCVWSATSGLAAAMTAGAVAFAGGRRPIAAIATHTFDASKDTYVALDAFCGDVAFYPVANGAATPTKGERELWCSKVVTNGAAVTGVTDLRETLPLDLDKVKDGSTYAKTLGAALSSGKVNLNAGTSGLANTLPGAQLADNAVAPVHVVGSVSRPNDMFGNANFVRRTRG